MNLTLLIDLDDTLLPDSTSKFLPVYISELADYLDLPAPKEKIIEVLFSATQEALATPRMDSTIQARFEERFYPALDTSVEALADQIARFYREEFPKFIPVKQPDPKAVALIEAAFEKGYQVAIATNPVFPQAATFERLRWAGLAPEKYPFRIVSTFENFHFGKPDPRYFLELIAQIGWPEGGFVMVGDSEEMDIQPAKSLGIPTYLLDPASAAELAAMDTSGDLSGVHPWIESLPEDEFALNLSSFADSILVLEANIAAIDTLLCNAPAGTWEIGPKRENWQINEILCHLRDVDLEVHLPRLTAVRYEAAPFLPAIDADSWADQRGYHSQDGRQAFTDLVSARKNLLAMAANLPETAGKKEIKHSIFGPITLDEILRIAARHDCLHVQQFLDVILAN